LNLSCSSYSLFRPGEWEARLYSAAEAGVIAQSNVLVVNKWAVVNEIEKKVGTSKTLYGSSTQLNWSDRTPNFKRSKLLISSHSELRFHVNVWFFFCLLRLRPALWINLHFVPTFWWDLYSVTLQRLFWTC
jgi:hypothetical protein